MTILNNKIAEREKLELHQTNIPRLLTATGQKMHVNGKINLDLTSAWQKGRIEVLVSSDLDDDMLLGIKHLREFKRILQGFGNTILNDHEVFCFRTTVKLLSEEFTTEFDNTLSDELNPLPMKGDPMRISLKPNAIPKKVTGARQVPLRYEMQ